jgi:hypothetical protein
MTRASIILLVTLSTSCAFAVKHPAITAGTVAGTLALGSCELASSEHAQCFKISAAGGVSIGLLAALALWLGYEDEAPAGGSPGGNDPINVDPGNLEPAPVFVPKALVDAGASAEVPVDAAVSIDAAVDAP